MAELPVISIINQFIYAPQATYSPREFSPADLALDFEDVVFKSADGVTLTGWYIKAKKPRHALLYCHGNGGNRRDWANAAPDFVERGINLFLFDYRGYGDSRGRPSEKGLYSDGEAAWLWLKDRAKNETLPGSILGKSLGTAIAVFVAAKYNPACLILDSAFTSMREAIYFNAPWLPKFLVPPLYESLQLASRIQCPTLVIHGDRDKLVPVSQGLRMYQALQCAKAFEIVKGAEHNDVASFSSYHAWIREFLKNSVEFTVGRQVNSRINEQWLAKKYHQESRGV